MQNFSCCAWALTLLAATASAQIRLPPLPLQLPVQPLQSAAQNLEQIDSRSLQRLSAVRHLEIKRLIRSNRGLLDLDPSGEPIIRNEILALSPSEAAAAIARSLNCHIVRERTIDALNIHLVVFRAPDSMSAMQALRVFRESDPDGNYDYNHIYFGSGAWSSAKLRPTAQNSTLPAASAAHLQVPHLQVPQLRVGLLDTGVDTTHPAFHESTVHAWGCGNKLIPAAHGTAVASLLIGRAQGFRGVQPDAALYAADVYCGQPTGGAVDALVAAIGWMVQEQVPVINISLVGARNAMLEQAVTRAIARGFIIVAAVGNDGPAAPPLYPASFPNVVGVTAVDAHRHVLIEAARGPQVMFAAPGADLAAAGVTRGYATVRGTSFAAPIVAGLLAASVSAPGTADASAAIDALAHAAIHLGSPGRDLTYGYGLVGAEYRIDPAPLLHR
jgi:subtilisin family serine protease